MKEFELKYKSALGTATTMYACAKESNDKEMIQSLELIFPELKKTKDELIREELIHFLETCRDPRFVGSRKQDEWIEWLEKQKPVLSEDDEKMIELLIKIFEVSYPNEFYKVNPVNTTDMKGIHSFEIIDWFQSLKNKVLPQSNWNEKDKTTLARLWNNINLGNK